MPTAAPTPCPTCHTLGPCPHRGAARHTRNGRRWQHTRTAILNAWRNEHGNWCPGWPPTGHPPHPSTDLTVHHIDGLATTGHDTGRHTVLCRSENSRIG